MKTKILLLYFSLGVSIVLAAQNDSIAPRKTRDTIEIEYKTAHGVMFYNGATPSMAEYVAGFYVGSHYIKNNLFGRQELKTIILREPLARKDFNIYRGWNGVKNGSDVVFLVSGGWLLSAYLMEDVTANENILVPVILGSGITYFVTRFITKKALKKSILTYNRVHK